MSASYRAIADAFIAGRKVPAPKRTLNGRKRLFADQFRWEFLWRESGRDTITAPQTRALFSYGYHFPLLIEDGACFWINTDRYYPSERERDDAGFHQSVWSKRDRSRMPSPTTIRQREEVWDALIAAGYTASDEENDWAIDGEHNFRMFVKNEGAQ